MLPRSDNLAQAYLTNRTALSQRAQSKANCIENAPSSSWELASILRLKQAI